MRLDMVALGVVVVAVSAAVFGNLGRAASPVTPEPLPEILSAASVTPDASAMRPMPPAACVDREPGQPSAASLEWLEPPVYLTSKFDTGCPAAP